MNNGAAQTAAAQQNQQQQAEQYAAQQQAQDLAWLQTYLAQNPSPVSRWGGIRAPMFSKSPAAIGGGQTSASGGLAGAIAPWASGPTPMGPNPAPPAPAAQPSPTPTPTPQGPGAPLPPGGPRPPVGPGSNPMAQQQGPDALAQGGLAALFSHMPSWQGMLIQRAIQDATAPGFTMHGGR